MVYVKIDYYSDDSKKQESIIYAFDRPWGVPGNTGYMIEESLKLLDPVGANVVIHCIKTSDKKDFK